MQAMSLGAPWLCFLLFDPIPGLIDVMASGLVQAMPLGALQSWPVPLPCCLHACPCGLCEIAHTRTHACSHRWVPSHPPHSTTQPNLTFPLSPAGPPHEQLVPESTPYPQVHRLYYELGRRCVLCLLC